MNEVALDGTGGGAGLGGSGSEIDSSPRHACGRQPSPFLPFLPFLSFGRGASTGAGAIFVASFSAGSAGAAGITVVALNATGAAGGAWASGGVAYCAVSSTLSGA